MLVSPKERKIVLIENAFGQTEIRETLAKVLFRHFEVSSILFVPSHMIALSSLAVSTAVVIDIGYAETTVMPVFSGVQIMPAFKDQGFGGRLIESELKKQLLESGVKEDILTPEILEDIKVRTCFVTTLERAQAYRSNSPPTPPPSVEYGLSNEILNISGVMRETAFEIMFEESNERDSLPHLILQSILRCPVDVRRQLVENIFVIGGTAIIMGLLPRLKSELEYLVSADEEYKTQLPGEIKFKFHKCIGRPNIAAWLGGSLCGGTDLIQTRSLTKEQYVKTERVPDWVCLADNRLAGS